MGYGGYGVGEPEGKRERKEVRRGTRGGPTLCAVVPKGGGRQKAGKGSGRGAGV